MSSRTITIFLEQIKSAKTREMYLFYLEKFVEYFKLRDAESIVTIEPKKLQEMVEDFVIHLKRQDKSKSYINGTSLLWRHWWRAQTSWRKSKMKFTEWLKTAKERGEISEGSGPFVESPQDYELPAKSGRRKKWSVNCQPTSLMESHPYCQPWSTSNVPECKSIWYWYLWD